MSARTCSRVAVIYLGFVAAALVLAVVLGFDPVSVLWAFGVGSPAAVGLVWLGGVR